MKTYTIFRSRKYGLIRKVLLVSILIGTVKVVFLFVNWAYIKMKSGAGEEVAQVTVAMQVVVVLVLTMIGLGFGYLVAWAIRHQRLIFRFPQPGGVTEIILYLWGFELKCEAIAEIPPLPPPPISIPEMEEIMVAPHKPRRRGRKPTFPLERWLPIAAQWENRDPIRDAFTLGELIAEHLGTNSDGTPIVSEQAYYTTWRPRAIPELQRRASAKQKALGSKSPAAPIVRDPEP